MKIYLAGKITGTEWRSTIVEDFDRWSREVGDDLISGTQEKWPKIQNAILGQHAYTGPYLVDLSDGHGAIQYADLPRKHRGDGGVSELCRLAIGESDVLFCWLDNTDAYASLVELGIASGLGKEVWIALPEVPELWEDLWFATEIASRLTEAKTPLDALRYFLRSSTPVNYREYIQSGEWRAKANAAKERAGWCCQICNKHKDTIQLDAHHRTYERLGAELPEDITVLCHDCHGKFHGKN